MPSKRTPQIALHWTLPESQEDLKLPGREPSKQKFKGWVTPGGRLSTL